MKVREAMTRRVVSVRPDTPFKEIVSELVGHSITLVPVVDDRRHVLGVVSEADLVVREAGSPRRTFYETLADAFLRHGKAIIDDKLHGAVAADLMTSPAAVLSPDDDVHAAARRMLGSGAKSMPVVHDGRLVGILSRSDLLKPFARSDGELLTDITRILESPLHCPEDHEVEATVEGGVAILQGTVLHPSDMRVVESMIREVPGVVEVVSRLTARESEPTVTLL